MDKRSLVSMITLSLGVFGLWYLFVSWYEKKYPQPVATTQPIVQTTDAGGSAGPASTQGALTSAPSTTAPAAFVGLHAVETPEPAASGFAVLGGSDKNLYAMQVFLTQHGAGVEKVVLNEFKETVRSNDPFTFQQAYAGHAGSEPLATQSISINGVITNLAGAPWKLIKSDPTSATYKVLLAEGDKAIAEVTKTFTISPKSNSNLGYEINVAQNVKSLTDHAIKIKEFFNGPTQPPREIERGGDLAVLVGFQQPGKNTLDIVQHTNDSSDFKAGAPVLDLTRDGDKHHALWAGQVSTYFNALVLPNPAGNLAQGFSVQAKALDPESDDRHVVLTFETDEAQLAAGADRTSLPMAVYFGPKSRDALKNTAYYNSFPRMYDLSLVIRSGPCGYCTWEWLINVLFAILRFFHFLVHDWGLAIICLVLLVRTLLHPLTKAGQVQMMKMQKLAPEMEKLKKKYADDKEGLNRAMVDFQKQNMPGQVLGCLPMFLQTPIWIALWSALQSTFELRQAPFLYNVTWIKDLAKPDGLLHFADPGIPLLFFGWHLHSINLLPVLMAVATYINQKYFMPQPVVSTPEQEQQQKMTRTMSVFFPLMFYTFPSGLNVYYLTSMTVGILESKIIRDHIKEKEEAEKAGRVFVETRATRGARLRNDETPEPKKGKFMQAFADLQKKVEDMTKEQKQKGKDKK